MEASVAQNQGLERNPTQKLEGPFSQGFMLPDGIVVATGLIKADEKVGEQFEGARWSRRPIGGLRSGDDTSPTVRDMR